MDMERINMVSKYIGALVDYGTACGGFLSAGKEICRRC
jgi:hypothetical protein